MKDDLKELRLALHWRKLCQNREKWGKSFKPVKRKATKGRASCRKGDKGRAAIPRFGDDVINDIMVDMLNN